MARKQRRKAERRYKKKVDPVAIQVSVGVPKLRGKDGKFLKIAPSVIQEVILAWADTGEAPPGFEIRGVEWENYGRHKERRFADDEESIEQARLTLKLGALFRGRFVSFSAIRLAQRTSPGGSSPNRPGPKKTAKLSPAIRSVARARTKRAVVPNRPNKKRLARGGKTKRATRTK